MLPRVFDLAILVVHVYSVERDNNPGKHAL